MYHMYDYASMALRDWSAATTHHNYNHHYNHKHEIKQQVFSYSTLLCICSATLFFLHADSNPVITQ